MQHSRREFLEFLGISTVTTLAATMGPSLLSSCTSSPPKNVAREWKDHFIPPSSQDDVIVASGIDKRILIKWNDPISKSGLRFGTNNDYCAFIPKDRANPTDGVLMVNHEYLHPLLVSGFQSGSGKTKTREQVLLEQDSVGVSLLRFHQTEKGWQIDFDSNLNRRITARTQIPFVASSPIEGKWSAQGTMANCAGGITPWGTFLTCEENYDLFYGEWDPAQSSKEKNRKRVFPSINYGWTQHDDHPPSHYGWVVEINPWTGDAKKLTGLGRICHEAATCVESPSGKTVVYTGDDTPNEHLYKFISKKTGSLEHGTLYVAQLETGKWLPITMNSHPEFRRRFKNETDLMVHVRSAAKILGATPLARPEDIEINPQNGDVIVALTNNPLTGNEHGSLLKIQEDKGDPMSLTFKSSEWIAGGPEAGLSCPDNMAFDRSGNLWVTTDISDSKMNKGIHAQFKNNGLYYIPMHGSRAGQVFQVASAPIEAEFTGPCFTPDGETLLLSVQHPGAQTRDLKKPTSTWPEGSLPKSAVIALTGETIRSLVNFRG